MRGSIGLIIYVAVLIIGGVMKKMAEDKVKQAKLSRGLERSPYVVTLEDMLKAAPATDTLDTPDSGLEKTGDKDWSSPRDEAKDKELGTDEGRETPPSQPFVGSSPEPQMLKHPNWEQAIILSEIIREPRAKRPWPSR